MVYFKLIDESVLTQAYLKKTRQFKNDSRFQNTIPHVYLRCEAVFARSRLSEEEGYEFFKATHRKVQFLMKTHGCVA